MAQYTKFAVPGLAKGGRVYKGQAVSTIGLTVGELNKIGGFAKFSGLPIELQEQVWKEYLDEFIGARDVCVEIVLKSLKLALWAKIKGKISKPSKAVSAAVVDPRNYDISFVYSSQSAPPPAAFSISHHLRSLAFQNLPHRFSMMIPSPANRFLIKKYVPVALTLGDTLTVTFPFASETPLSLIAFVLSPGYTRYTRPPPELLPPLWRQAVDRRVLKGAGVVLEKRDWTKGGRKVGKTVLTFKMVEVAEGLDVDVEKALGGKKVWKELERLRGMPVGRWDVCWLKMMEKLEVEGKDVTDTGLMD